MKRRSYLASANCGVDPGRYVQRANYSRDGTHKTAQKIPEHRLFLESWFEVFCFDWIMPLQVFILPLFSLSCTLMICCRTKKFAELRLLIYLIQTFMSVHNFYWVRRSDGKDGLSRPHLRVPANVILHSQAGYPIFFGFAHWTIPSPLAISKLAMDEGPSIEVGYNYPRK